MLRYGFEREYFVLKGKQHVAVPKYMPEDACGYLAEARGLPATTPIDAVYNLFAAEYKLQAEAKKNNVRLSCKPATRELPREFTKHMLQTHGKNIAKSHNAYGYVFPDNNYSYAGLHVHFSDQRDITHIGPANTTQTVIAAQLDMPRIINALDRKFIKEIAEAKRQEGWYELKPWGFEYRSLPASIDAVLVAEFLCTLI